MGPPTMLGFFDVDHTLIQKTSIEAVFIKWLFFHGKISISRIYAVLRFFLAHLDDIGGTALRGNKMYLKGMKYDDMQHYTTTVCEKYVKRLISKDGMQEIQKLKQEGKRVVLLSASPAPLISYVSEYVGADDSIATSLEESGGILTGTIAGLHPYGARKITAAIKYAQQRGVALKSCTAYANAFSDVPLLQVAGQAVAVNPDRHLHRWAKHRGWRIIYFK